MSTYVVQYGKLITSLPPVNWVFGRVQLRSQGETVTKTLVRFVLSFQNFGEKIACAVRNNRFQPYCNTVVLHCACDFFPKILER